MIKYASTRFMIKDNFLYSDITAVIIIKANYNVYNTLGFGFLERVYENAIMIELNKLGLSGEKQKQIDVYYDNEKVGLYFADIVIENKIIVELKATEIISVEHEIQLVNYFKATDLEVGLLLNFGRQPEYKRKVLLNELKKKTNKA